MDILWIILAAVVGIAIGVAAGYMYRKDVAEKKIGRTEEYAKKLLDDATRKADDKKKEMLLEAKEEILHLKTELDKEKVTSAADKVVKAFNEFGKPKIESLLHDARSFTIEELKELHEKLGQLIEDMEQAQQEADVILSAEEEPSVPPENEE